jgi:hypothetical protein
MKQRLIVKVEVEVDLDAYCIEYGEDPDRPRTDHTALVKEIREGLTENVRSMAETWLHPMRYVYRVIQQTS